MNVFYFERAFARRAATAMTCLIITVAAAGCVETPKQDAKTPIASQKITLSTTQQAAVRIGVASYLKDPASAQFSSMAAAKNLNTGLIYVCGFLNAKNSFGGYTGSQLYHGSLTNLPGLSPIFMPLSIGGSDQDQQVAATMCRENGVFN